MTARLPTVADCQVVDLPKIHNQAGNITPLHGETDVPFPIRRVYYLYDVPGGESRGGHAHHELRQLIVAASGSFEVVLRDGTAERTVFLNRPYQGLLMPRMIWRDLINFSSGGICLVLASHSYDEADYIRDYAAFTALRRAHP